ncbi:NUDIX hydrolase [Chlorobium phaeobacteroides]|uniref:8-oxo-dGTPase n=1 Tax=Chlorobium phaeobacteroides (strain DSM 266 / SMG 266 / 2430) TaxID=290317 RepID=A1BEV4_CHLPD|nr:NUDIX hydrolase [Chlorobium phaeobacteroides]ABL64931.1 8-oxo-dGTPase [Chlorobium phaeobacteroides DSM 266]MBV5326170.1 NUDIX hydrolase [Chlorobium sp.]
MKPYSFCPICGASLSNASIDGRERMYCPLCKWVHYINPLPVAIAFAVNSNNELLVVRRAHEPAFNEWALPGGFLEAGEEPHDGCLRELMEETSLSGKVERLIGLYHREVELYGSLLVVAYMVRVDHEEISLNHELFDAGFYPRELMPPIRIPLHNRIISDADSL